MRPGYVLMFWLGLIALGGEAQAANRIIAVLPLDVSHTKGKLDADGQASIEEMLRDVATTALSASGWTILTGETTLQVLQDNGVDSTKCGDQNCHLSMAREIKAEKFLSGAVQYVEGEFTASIRLIDTASGRILSSERVEGNTITALRKAFEAKGNNFFVRGGLLEASDLPDNGNRPPPPAPDADTDRPHVKKNKVTQAIATLSVVARPKDKVRLELVDSTGKKIVSGAPYENAQATPGHWKVTARAKGFAEETQEIEVPADDVTVVRFDLKPFGGLTVEGSPKGADVVVTGPDGFQDEGGLPWEGTGLKPGAYQVSVKRKGYAGIDQTAEVRSGETANIKIALEKNRGEGETKIEPRTGLEFVRHAGGKFNYGCEPGDKSCDGDEKPPQEVTLAPFWILRTEVTVEAYSKCVALGVCSQPNKHHFTNRCNYGDDDLLKHPINCVDWSQADVFCTWLGGRLPTAQEWEFAAKGGESRIYPWGSTEPNDKLANFKSRHTTPVGSFPDGATRFGLLDMAGNVSEWTASDKDDGNKEIRGAARDNSADDLRASHREGQRIKTREPVIGFRCAM